MSLLQIATVTAQSRICISPTRVDQSRAAGSHAPLCAAWSREMSFQQKRFPVHKTIKLSFATAAVLSAVVGAGAGTSTALPSGSASSGSQSSGSASSGSQSSGSASTGSQDRSTTQERVQELPDGMTARLKAPVLSVRKGTPLDRGLLSRDAFVSADVSATIEGLKNDSHVAGTLEIGYEFGFPVSMPGAFDVTLNTPDVSVTGGTNAALSPNAGVGGINLGELGVESSTTVDVLPSQQVEFTLNPSAGVTEVPLLKSELAGSTFSARYTDVAFHATNVVGPLTIRPYVKLRVVVAGKGDYLLTIYGTPVVI